MGKNLEVNGYGLIAIKVKVTKGKGKVHPRAGHEGPEGEQMYNFTLLLTSVLDVLCGQRHAPAALSVGTTHCKRGWMGPKADIDGILTHSPDYRARSESLYRLNYPGTITIILIKIH